MKTTRMATLPALIIVAAIAGAHFASSFKARAARLDGAAAEVVINEVLYYEDSLSPDPLRRNEWVELHNRGVNSINLAGWALSDRDGRNGSGERALPNVMLPPGSYLVVHLAAGQNDFDFADGCGEYYTGDVGGIDLFDNRMDEVALYSAAQIVDFVAWNAGDTGYMPGNAHNDAVAAGQWTAGEFINSAKITYEIGGKFRVVRPGTSIGRDKDSTDTNHPNDWDAHGGRDASDITPCRRNLDLLNLRPIITPPPTLKAWTVMIYISGDNDLEPFAYKDLKEIEAAGGSDKNINVVVMVDGLNTLRQVSLDADNNLIEVPGTLGKTFRFQVGAEVDSRYVRMLNHSGDNPLIGERDLGDPKELAGFIAWAKARYPAKKYGLILWDHGKGWKSVCRDDTEDPVHGKKDRLYMGELTTALTGHKFELIGFDVCLMAMTEVAYQIEPFSRYMVASEETEAGDGWPYDRWLPRLKANPNWNGAKLGAQIVKDFHDFYTAPDPTNPGQELDPQHTLSLIDQAKLPALVDGVSAFGEDLRQGSDDFRAHDIPNDNVEHHIALDSAATERFDDENFMDLHDFADRIGKDAGIPACYKAHAARVRAQLKAAVLAEQHGSAHPDANGLTIYMPLERTADNLPPNGDEPYDYPTPSRVSDEKSQRAMYAPNNDALPLQARDVESGAPLVAPVNWPLVPTPNFRFPALTLWDEFLMRFYHPVADNHIIYALGPEGQIAFPNIIFSDCGNAFDEITISPGWTVYFSGAGSSDADTNNRLPRHWMWDFDHAIKGCSLCLPPYGLPAGLAADVADDDMDADHNANPAPLDDEKEADGESVSHLYVAPRDYVVTLNAWDDNHTFAFHDTNPTALFVHPQTDSHISIVHVIPNDGPPSCIPDPSGVTPEGQTFTRVAIRDADSGLVSVRLLIALNAQVTIPRFEVGTREPVIVTLVKLDQTKDSLVKLEAIDVGGNVSMFQSELLNPKPSLSSLNPNTAAADSGVLKVTLNGSNFLRNAVARWNDSDRATTFINNTQLTTEISALDLARAGTVGITVFNPAPGGGASNALNFNVMPPATPAITSVTDASNLLEITGRGFSAVARVEINGTLVDLSFQFDGAKSILSARPKSRNLNLRTGFDNQIVAIENGIRSLPFLLRLG